MAVLGNHAWIRQFYLAGGTACALRLGHRLSFDLDFFTLESFDAKKLAKQLQKAGSFQNDRVTKDTLLGVFSGTKVSFFKYNYPLIDKTDKFEGVIIVGLADIAAMKIDAVSDRGRKRDFIDLYFIAKKYTLEKIFAFYDQKYKLLKTNRIYIFKSLFYFIDAENDPMPHMLTKVTWAQVKQFFENEVKKIAKSTFYS